MFSGNGVASAMPFLRFAGQSVKTRGVFLQGHRKCQSVVPARRKILCKRYSTKSRMALITGFMAKESVVSTLSILFGSTESLLAAISPLAAVSLPVLSLLYTPCVVAFSSL